MIHVFAVLSLQLCDRFLCKLSHADLGAHLVVPPETCQSIGVDDPEHKTVLVFPSDVFLITIVTQQLIHIVPQQSALWPLIKTTRRNKLPKLILLS